MVSEEVDEAWRTIPGFTKYEITEQGDVRNFLTGKLLPEHQNKKTKVWYYSLHGDGGKKSSRSSWSLIYLAWPELLREWAAIPGYPNYLVHPDGRVMSTILYRELPKTKHGSYRLHKDGKRCHWYFTELEYCGLTWEQLWGEAA